MPSHARIIRVARYRPQPGATEDLRAALHALARELRELSGVFGAQVCRIDEHPDWLALVSRWADEQSMQATGGPGIEELVDRVAGQAQEQQIEHFIAE